MKKSLKQTEENIVLWPVADVPIYHETEEAITDAARYLDTERALAHVNDGCKPSYRRLIWTALQFPKGELQPSTNIVGGMSKYHPHDLTGCEPLLAAMVRSGIMTGTGSFGTKSILGDTKPAASPRYTKTRLSDLYYETLKPLMQCIKKVESPVGPLECEKIGVPQPICLSFKGLVSGIGVGISTIYPNFSPKSLYQAYIKNDPSLLEPNVNLLLDKKNSELQKLWTTGKGKVIYSYKLSRQLNEDGKAGFLFEGDTCIFVPNLRKISKYVDSGQVFIDDLTDKKGPKMFVGLVSNRGSLDLDGLEKLCRQCCYDSTNYQLNVTDGVSAFRIPLYDWLDYTYKNYIQLVTDVNNLEMRKIQFEIAILEALPIVSNYIINENPKATDKEIIERTGIPAEVVSNVMSKPISYLRKNKDTSDRIKVLKQRLKDCKAFDPVDYTEKVIERL